MKITLNKTEEIELTERERIIYKRAFANGVQMMCIAISVAALILHFCGIIG